MALTDGVAVVTGAGRGIGRLIALGLAREGAFVVAVSRNAEELERLAVEIRATGGEAEPFRADVSDADDVGALADHIRARHGRLLVLVNNAALRMDHIGGGPAYPYRMPLVDVPVEQWDRMMATNVRGPFLTCKLLAPMLFASGGASVINVSAGAGVRGQAGRAPYTASKFALEGLTQALAEEWHDAGVAVNSLEPGGSVLTDGVKAGLVAVGTDRRFLRPEVMVPPAVFLASQNASGVTGRHVNALAWCVERGLGGPDGWYAR